MDLQVMENHSMGQGLWERLMSIQKKNLVKYLEANPEVRSPTITDPWTAEGRPTREQVLRMKYPEATSPENAELWEQLLSDPKAFYRASMNAYNSTTNKAQYKTYIHDAIMELHNRLGQALPALEKLSAANTTTWVQTFIPEWQPWAWLVWLQKDINGFLGGHLNSIKTFSPEDLASQVKYLKDITNQLPDGWLENASMPNQELYLQLVEPELYAAIIQEQGAKAAAFSRQEIFGRVAGFGILGVIVVGLFSMGGKKRRR